MHEEDIAYVLKRDKLFALCMPGEQANIADIARWHAAHKPRLLPTDNLLRSAYAVVSDYRHIGRILRAPRPGLSVQVMAALWKLVFQIETNRTRRMRAAFIRHLDGLCRDTADADVMYGTLYFLRMLPVRLGEYGSFDAELDALAARCADDARAPVQRRFEAMRRCKLWPSDLTGWNTPQFASLQIWRLLLELAKEDLPAAARVVDEEWIPLKEPSIFSWLAFHDDPQLASQLATAFWPERQDFAVECLSRSIWDCWLRGRSLKGDEAAELAVVVDASCVLLARWVVRNDNIRPATAQTAISNLFRCGDPAQPYWRELPEAGLRIARPLSLAEQAKQIPLLAAIAFYSTPGEATHSEALQMLEAAVNERLTGPPNWQDGLESAVFDSCRAALEHYQDHAYTHRNARVPADISLRVWHVIDRLLDHAVERADQERPESALQHRARVIRGLDDERLIRKHHQLLREGFADAARAKPDDAGLALEQIVMYCGFSQSEHQKFKPALCRETYDLLIPVLDAISPRAGAVARRGVGWTPRRPD